MVDGLGNLIPPTRPRFAAPAFVTKRPPIIDRTPHEFAATVRRRDRICAHLGDDPWWVACGAVVEVGTEREAGWRAYRDRTGDRPRSESRGEFGSPRLRSVVQTLSLDETCCAQAIPSTLPPTIERRCATNRAAKTSGGLGNPTAFAKFNRGVPEGLKIGPNLRVGVQISLYLIPDLILGLAFEAREEVVHGGVFG